MLRSHDCPTTNGRNRQGFVGQRADTGDGRTDRGAFAKGGRASLCDHPGPEEPRVGDHLHQSPLGGGFRGRGSRDGVAGRTACRHGRHGGSITREADRDDGGSADRVGVSPTRGVAGSGTLASRGALSWRAGAGCQFFSPSG